MDRFLAIYSNAQRHQLRRFRRAGARPGGDGGALSRGLRLVAARPIRTRHAVFRDGRLPPAGRRPRAVYRALHSQSIRMIANPRMALPRWCSRAMEQAWTAGKSSPTTVRKPAVRRVWRECPLMRCTAKRKPASPCRSTSPLWSNRRQSNRSCMTTLKVAALQLALFDEDEAANIAAVSASWRRPRARARR